MLAEEISRQEEVVNDLRFRVEAEDKLLESQAQAKAERKQMRKEEKERCGKTPFLSDCHLKSTIVPRQAGTHAEQTGIFCAGRLRRSGNGRSTS